MKTRRNPCSIPFAAIAALLAGGALAAGGPLKVFILAGQSNMQGHAHVRTFDVIGLDPETAPMLAEMQGPDGEPRVCDDVWISSIGSAEEERVGKLSAGYGAAKGGPKIGPEFTFGLSMRRHLGEPILLIKTAWGGKSLNTDFRPPGAGPYEFDEAVIRRFEEQGKDVEKIRRERADASGRYYRLMIDHVRQVLGDIGRVYPDYRASEGYELAGFVWFQGWNDMVDSTSYPDRDKPGGYDAYSRLLAQFIRDVRKDLEAPELPFVIGVMGAGGPVAEYGPDKQRYAAIHESFRQAMAAPAALPEFEGGVAAVRTEDFWDMELEKLRARDRELRQTVEQAVAKGDIAKAEKAAELEKRRAGAFKPRELRILDEGVSNAEFHYLGSAKILGRIGKAFADRLVEMREE